MLTLKFESRSSAVDFCKKRGWKHTFRPDRKSLKKYGDKGYDENFLNKRVKSRLKADKMGTKWFQRSKAGASHYFRPLKYHGDGLVPQFGPNGTKPIDKDVESYYKSR